MSSNQGICLKEIQVQRKNRCILNVRQFQVQPGEFVSIVGNNGAGKTTLLKVCCGLLRPQKGQVWFYGQDFCQLGDWRRSVHRRRIGYIAQRAEYHADLPFTLREVVTMGCKSGKHLLRSIGPSEKKSVDHWLSEMGLADRADQTFRSLSGGQQQKALIARAMTGQPDVLVLDEPGANLDFGWKMQLKELLERLYTQSQVTVILVSHDLFILPKNCPRLVLMHEGEILADGDFEQVLSGEQMSQAYECGVEVKQIEGQWVVLKRT